MGGVLFVWASDSVGLGESGGSVGEDAHLITTVEPLSKKGCFTVQAIVQRSAVHHVMVDLFALGARAILVTDIHACRL